MNLLLPRIYILRSDASNVSGVKADRLHCASDEKRFEDRTELRKGEKFISSLAAALIGGNAVNLCARVHARSVCARRDKRS